MNLTIDVGIIYEAFGYYSTDHMALLHMLVPEKDNVPQLLLCYDNDGQDIIKNVYDRCIQGFGNYHLRRGYEKWITRLHERKAIYLCSGKISEKDITGLKKLGCNKNSDLIFIGVAFNSKGILISENVWHGKAHEEKKG